MFHAGGRSRKAAPPIADPPTLTTTKKSATGNSPPTTRGKRPTHRDGFFNRRSRGLAFAIYYISRAFCRYLLGSVAGFPFSG